MHHLVSETPLSQGAVKMVLEIILGIAFEVHLIHRFSVDDSLHFQLMLIIRLRFVNLPAMEIVLFQLFDPPCFLPGVRNINLLFSRVGKPLWLF